MHSVFHHIISIKQQHWASNPYQNSECNKHHEELCRIMSEWNDQTCFESLDWRCDRMLDRHWLRPLLKSESDRACKNDNIHRLQIHKASPFSVCRDRVRWTQFYSSSGIQIPDSRKIAVRMETKENGIHCGITIESECNVLFCTAWCMVYGVHDYTVYILQRLWFPDCWPSLPRLHREPVCSLPDPTCCRPTKSGHWNWSVLESVGAICERAQTSPAELCHKLKWCSAHRDNTMSWYFGSVLVPQCPIFVVWLFSHQSPAF